MYAIGDKILIHHLYGEPPESDYHDRVGIIRSIDDEGQLHGTWGGLAVIPGEDDFEIIND